MQTPLALFWSICAPARVRPRPRWRAALGWWRKRPVKPPGGAPRPVRSRRPGDAAARLSISPLPPRRSEELKQGPAQASANVSPLPGISALRLGEATFENTPLPPRRSEEFASDAAPAADNAPPAPSVVHLARTRPRTCRVPPRRPDELRRIEFGMHRTRIRRPFAFRRARPRGRAQRAAAVAAAPAGRQPRLPRKAVRRRPHSSSPALGYAPTDGGVTTAARSVMSMSSPARGYDQYTAIYDISAHTVYLPNGTRSRRIRASAAGSTIRAT